MADMEDFERDFVQGFVQWEEQEQGEKSFKYLFGTFLFFLATVVFDLLSSIPHVRDFNEMNPYARHSNGEFWLKHAMIQNGIDTLAFAAMSLALYIAGRTCSKKFGYLLACLPWLYWGYEHLDAGYHNLMNWMGLYVELDGFMNLYYQNFLKFLFGGN